MAFYKTTTTLYLKINYIDFIFNGKASIRKALIYLYLDTPYINNNIKKEVWRKSF